MVGSLDKHKNEKLEPLWKTKLDEPLEFYSSLDNSSLAQSLAADLKSGLSTAEAEARLMIVGENRQSEHLQVHPLKIFVHQFQSSVVLLLLAAAVASMVYNEALQAAGIMAAVLINAITGFYMEYKAGVSLMSLEALSGQSIRSIRDGVHCELPVQKIVPGDLVVLEAGCRVPADIRLVEACSLSMDESPLTGESAPVFKDCLAKSGENANLAFHGTMVAGGRGLGIAIKTGDRSSLGKLGKLLESTETGSTPLEMQLEALGKQLTFLTVVICALVTIVGVFHHQNLLLMVETGVALAVAAIPEGLPVLATLALAVGTQRMVRNRAILRHLAAVETLGCTSIICTDKTGTLTENQMTVCKLYLKDRLIDVSGTGYTPSGDFQEKNQKIDPSQDHEIALQELLLAGCLCNDAKLEREKDDWHVHGDPTEGALLTLAQKAGIDLSTLTKSHPRVAEFPFDLRRKRMSTVHHTEDGVRTVYTKGSPGAMIKLCNKMQSGSETVELTDRDRQLFMNVNEGFAQQGLRVLALAKKTMSEDIFCIDQEEIETELTLLGLVAIKDPPREGVKAAIEACKKAGIRILMLTGDQALTARAIARELGILDSDSSPNLVRGSDSGRGTATCKAAGAETDVVTGADLEQMDEEQAKNCLASIRVLARVTPDHKLAIVRTLQGKNAIVAMTGDGVNDAPALKQANIGVAMGQKGTDLARSVSQMVITDDNFSTIVKAIEQGRIIYGNIQRAVGYLLTASLASVVTVALGIVCDIGLPLSPLQLLWLNLIMHIFPGLGIVLQKADKSVMEQRPRDPDSKLIAAPQQIQIWLRSIVVSIAVLYAVANEGEHRTTIGLTTLSMCLLLQAWSWLQVREKGASSHTFPRLEIGTAMYINMAAAYALLFAAIYLPVLGNVLATSPLGKEQLAFCIIISIASFLATLLLELFLHKFQTR